MAYTVDKDGNYKRSVRCGRCYEVGHNKLSCPTHLARLPEWIKEAKQEVKDTSEGTWEHNYAIRRLRDREQEYHKMTNRGKDRACGFCRGKGHNRATCPERKEKTRVMTEETIALRKYAASSMESAGYGIGSLVQVGIRANGEIQEPVMAIVTGVQFDQLYSRDHKYAGGRYFYPPQIIQYQLVRPKKSRYDESVTTHGRAYLPVDFLNPDQHKLPEDGLSNQRGGPVLLSDVTCSSLLPEEAIDFKTISKYVCQKFVDPRD